jgi:hypothetical protein
MKTRVRGTVKTVVGDVKVHHQRHRTHFIHEIDVSIDNQLNVPTSLTPTPNHLLCFHFVSSERGHRFDHPPSRDPSWYPNGRYKYRVGHQEHLFGTFCNHNPEAAFPQGPESGIQRTRQKRSVRD